MSVSVCATRHALAGRFAAVDADTSTFVTHSHSFTPILPLPLRPRHLNSTAFTLATEDLPADDSRMAQMVLALTAAVGSWQASCLSWLWVGIPPV